MPAQRIHYKRSRFSTSLPEDLLYTPGHAWLRREPDDGEGSWRVGFTKFAVRMLGELVELDFEVEAGAAIEQGQVIGWIEGFKAVTDIYAPLTGTFTGRNAGLDEDMGLLDRACYDRGWLFDVRGTPDEHCVDVQGYMAHLDATIDKMLGQRHGSPADP